jgi:tRNA threonylcarbamoyladenosine modification (KEOPS) complex  Pcc1 subunit
MEAIALKTKASIRLNFQSEKILKVVFKALLPEIKKPATSRSKAFLKCEESCLILLVEARDTVALRAALNAYLRWIAAVCEALSILNGFRIEVT